MPVVGSARPSAGGAAAGRAAGTADGGLDRPSFETPRLEGLVNYGQKEEQGRMGASYIV